MCRCSDCGRRIANPPASYDRTGEAYCGPCRQAMYEESIQPPADPYDDYPDDDYPDDTDLAPPLILSECSEAFRQKYKNLVFLQRYGQKPAPRSTPTF